MRCEIRGCGEGAISGMSGQSCLAAQGEMNFRHCAARRQNAALCIERGKKMQPGNHIRDPWLRFLYDILLISEFKSCQHGEQGHAARRRVGSCCLRLCGCCAEHAHEIAQIEAVAQIDTGLLLCDSRILCR